jgi:hypothetical protein
VLERGGADLGQVLIDLDAVAGFGEQLGQPGLAGVQRLRPDIVAAERQQQIEGDQPDFGVPFPGAQLFLTLCGY